MLKRERGIILFIICMIGIHCIISKAFAGIGFPIPEDAYCINEIAGALEEAKTDDWALTFLLSDENTRCGYAVRASLDIIDELEEESIIIYVEPKAEQIKKCPEIVQKALRSGKAGKLIPIAVVVTPDVDRVIDLIPFKKSQEEHIKLLQKANAKISEKPTFLTWIKDKLFNIIPNL